MIQSRIRRTGHVRSVEEMKYAHETLIGKYEERRLLQRPRQRWENIIKMVIWVRTGFNWLKVKVQLTVVNTVINLCV